MVVVIAARKIIQHQCQHAGKAERDASEMGAAVFDAKKHGREYDNGWDGQRVEQRYVCHRRVLIGAHD